MRLQTIFFTDMSQMEDDEIFSKTSFNENSQKEKEEKVHKDSSLALDIQVGYGNVSKTEHNIKDTLMRDKDSTSDDKLIYRITDRIPLHLTLLFALQQSLLSLSLNLVVSLLVAEVVCAKENDEFKAKLLSSTMFMSGLTTLLQVTVGIRLPFYQGPILEYVAPLLVMTTFNKDQCNFAVIRRTNGMYIFLTGVRNVSISPTLSLDYIIMMVFHFNCFLVVLLDIQYL
ncbi:hypothetical protein KUTeg_001719 [Tegillarca granosa]|uniref:Uncharacterized protein n=1 Tax=Tegillarca granosa TaxID=220873 RepID=A0ABQ9FTR8_TEGGR|nr:hypothetical protein KUTeg_001719 [Tegillarca granosa]